MLCACCVRNIQGTREMGPTLVLNPSAPTCTWARRTLGKREKIPNTLSTFSLLSLLASHNKTATQRSDRYPCITYSAQTSGQPSPFGTPQNDLKCNTRDLLCGSLKNKPGEACWSVVLSLSDNTPWDPTSSSKTALQVFRSFQDSKILNSDSDFRRALKP